MNDTSNETVLAQRRLHWGIFILPLLAIFALFLATLPVIITFHFMTNTVSQFTPQTSRPIGGFFVLIFVLPQILVCLPLLLITWVAYLKSNITLTDRRLIFRTGLLARVTGELPLENVDAIYLTEPFLGRFLGYGTVLVTSLGGLHFPLQYLASQQAFHATLQWAVGSANSPSKAVAKSGKEPPDDDSRYMPKK